MQTFAYGIVLSSTATHAYWNFLLKRSRGGSVFVGLSKVVEVVVFGESGKIADVYKKFDITTEAVVHAARDSLQAVYG